MLTLDRVRGLTPAGFKLALARALTSPPMDRLVRQAFPDGVPHYGSRITPAGQGTAAALLFGLYERAEILMTRKFLPPGMDVVELGGSIGANTCLIARKARRVLSVEADPNLAERLRATVTANGLPNVTVIAKAVAGRQGGVGFQRGADSISGQLSPNGITVPAVSLSSLLTDHGIGPYALVSDCEGAEVEILKEDPEALSNCEIALVEMGGLGFSPDDVERLFIQIGFRSIYRHGPCAVFERDRP